MYESFYHLTHNPFQISTDPKFLWLGEKHKEALATMNYGVLSNKSFLLLTGDVGTGKTTLINAMLKGQGADVIRAIVQDPGLPVLDFFNFLALEYGLEQTFASKGPFLIAFRKFLSESYYRGKRVLLIIDESQRLKQDILEEIRLLSNIEIEGNKLINIFFVGQNEFNEILLKEENKAIKQRITVCYNIPPLSSKEIAKYIEYRLAVAGANKRIFEKDAIEEIYSFSKGYPRLINIICDRALLTGFVNGAQLINRKIIRECAEELDFSAQTISPFREELQGKRNAGGGNQAKDVAPAPAKRYRLEFVVALFALIAVWAIFKNQSSPPAVSENVPVQTVMPKQERPAPTVSVKADKQERELVADARAAVVTSRNDKTLSSHDDAVQVKTPLPRPALPEKIVIPFKFNSITPEYEYVEILKKFTDAVLQHDNVHVVIRGFTDNVGSEQYNKKLAEFRANSIRNFLIGRGVPLAQVSTVGGGVSAEAAGDQAAVRRVEVEVFRDQR